MNPLTYLKKNKRELEIEKKRVEDEIMRIDQSDQFENTTSSLQETEIEARNADLEMKEGNLSIRRTLMEYLHQVKTALALINKKKYGICDRCGKQIAHSRLDANPAAIYCLECAEIMENEEN